MIIGIDVDGVLADFNTSYIDLIIKVTGEDKFPPRPFTIHTWYYAESYGYSADQIKCAWAQIKKGGFWKRLDAYRSAQSLLNLLDKLTEDAQHSVYFITDRAGASAKDETEGWLALRGVFNPTVIISGQKAKVCDALNIQYYIDDKNENCLSVRDQGSTKVFMLAQGWNQEIPGVPRLNHLDEFETILREATSQP